MSTSNSGTASSSRGNGSKFSWSNLQNHLEGAHKCIQIVTGIISIFTGPKTNQTERGHKRNYAEDEYHQYLINKRIAEEEERRKRREDEREYQKEHNMKYEQELYELKKKVQDTGLSYMRMKKNHERELHELQKEDILHQHGINEQLCLNEQDLSDVKSSFNRWKIWLIVLLAFLMVLYVIIYIRRLACVITNDKYLS